VFIINMWPDPFSVLKNVLADCATFQRNILQRRDCVCVCWGGGGGGTNLVILAACIKSHYSCRFPVCLLDAHTKQPQYRPGRALAVPGG
jgi:hypothetical protein